MTRETFLFYADWSKVIKDLPSEVQLEIYQAITEYAINGNLIELKPLAKVAFGFIKQTIDRDTKNYQEKVKTNQEKGRYGNLKRWSRDLYDKVLSKELSLEEAEKIAVARKKSHNEKENRTAKTASLNGNDSDNVNDNDSFINKTKHKEKESEKEKPPLGGTPTKSFKILTKQEFVEELKPFTEKFGKDMVRGFYEYWTEPSASGKMKFQLEKTWDTSRRLSTWARNEKKFNPKEEKKQTGHVARDGTRITMF